MNARTPRLAVAIVLVAGSVAARADGVDGYVEVSRSHLTNDARVVGEPVVVSDTDTLVQRYNVTWNQRLFPNVRMQIGALYERTDATIDENGFSQDVLATRFRPFARFSLRSDRFMGEAGWDRNEDSVRTGDLATLRITRDTYIGVFGWFPSQLPSARLEITHVDDRDSTGQTEDRTRDTVRLTSDYTPVPSTAIYYRGSFERQDDRVAGSSFDSTTHTGEVRYGDVLFDKRWEIGVNWTGSYREVQVDSSGAGEIVTPVFPLAGLFILDDTPDEGTLDALPALIDQNTLVGTSVNLGLPPPGGDQRPRNLGVDFGLGRDVNRVRVWVDRELPVEIASTFAWEVWTSDDGRLWTRRSVVASAPFGPFDNRFEFSFPRVFTRYLKVVVRPLVQTAPSASTFPVILVTELETLFAQPASSVGRTTSSTRHLVQANSRVRLLRNFAFYYEATYFLATTSGAQDIWTLSNGLSFQRTFGPVWSVSARAAREDGVERGGDRTGYVYTAALAANPLPTLRHTLSVSGTEDVTGGFRQSNRGVLLNSTAAVYRGVDVNAGVGLSTTEATNSLSTEALQTFFGATIVPHRTVTLTLRYDDRNATLTGKGVSDRTDRIRAAEAAVAINPLPSVYFYASHREESRTGEPQRDVEAISLSWSPFPGGALRLSINYSENRNSFNNELNKVFTPSLRWNISGRTYVDVSYQRLSTDSDLGPRRQSVLTGTLRVGF